MENECYPECRETPQPGRPQQLGDTYCWAASLTTRGRQSAQQFRIALEAARNSQSEGSARSCEFPKQCDIRIITRLYCFAVFLRVCLQMMRDRRVSSHQLRTKYSRIKANSLLVILFYSKLTQYFCNGEWFDLINIEALCFVGVQPC